MAPQVNGTVNGVHASATLDHLLRYPVVSDGVTTVQKNKYGQQGITLGTNVYKTFAEPVLPYFQKPYGYVSPYVKRADDLGDSALSKLDNTFPVVKRPTSELYSEAKGLALLPLRKGMEGKEHFVDVYNGERKDLGGDGVVATGKAFAMAVLIVTSEALAWTRNQLAAAKEQTQQKVQQEKEKASN